MELIVADISQTLGTYRQLVTRRFFWLATASITLAAIIVADILVGPAFLNVFDVLGSLILSEKSSDPMVYVIVHNIRLPMTLMAITVGASLGIAGVQMQTILGNPLASPYTLGFSAAAGFGAAVTILFGLQLPLLPEMTVPVAAFAMAGFACTLVYGFAHIRGITAEVMILAGIATLFLFQSLQSLIQYLASPEVLQEIVFWLFGSMLKATWFSVSVSASILLISGLLLAMDSWKLTALRLGDERARSLGINVNRLRLRIFVIVSFLTAGAVAFVGTIGFVGLVAPHIARMLVGEDHRLLMPLSGIIGAVIMVGASIVSKVISPGAVVPIGIVTAVIGVPFLFALILAGKKRHW
ncbi:MAG: iron ABC transporter permease [Hyphomicrobiales bacterium]|nr:iron ABC transporter permease [Hyphomicrobiales bacterium]